MEYKQNHIELIEKIIKKSPGFRGNEDLLEEMTTETLNKAQSFLESPLDASSLEVYIKKIAGNVIVDIVKNAEKVRTEKSKKLNATEKFEEVPVSYETDKEGKIVYKVEIPSLENKETLGMNEEEIDKIKEKIIELDKKSSSKNYKQIFELRFTKTMDYREIARKLEMKENDVSKALLEIFREIDST